jgi:hypothetical protein
LLKSGWAADELHKAESEQIIHEAESVNRRDRQEKPQEDAEKNLEEKEKAVILVML